MAAAPVRAPLLAPLPEAPRGADGRIDLDAVVDRIGRDRSILLESHPGLPDAGRWSYVAVTGTATLHDDGTAARLVTGDDREKLGTDPFVAVDRMCDRLGLIPDAAAPDPDLPPFTGGLVGAFGYDLARRVERLPVVAADDRADDHMHLAVTGAVVAVDHTTEEAVLVCRDLPLAGAPGLATAPVIRAALARPAPVAPPAPPPSRQRVMTSLPRDAYLAAVRTVLGHIAAGDTFQVNVTQRLTARAEGDAHDVYRRLRRESPAAHGAVVPAVGIASISPETFLRADGRRILTRPIKGTRPRDPDPERDARNARDLRASPKDVAENVMVVDMERNDLGRVCDDGSVHVPRLLEVERHPTVWHLVSTVEGRLRADVGWGGALAATFPCGSVTGTPKVRAMEVIETVEPVRRGWYCGAVGFLGAGALSLSVAIRTAVVAADGTVDYGAGGGIVADSDPEAEHLESLDKAAAFLRAVGGTL